MEQPSPFDRTKSRVVIDEAPAGYPALSRTPWSTSGGSVELSGLVTVLDGCLDGTQTQAPTSEEREIDLEAPVDGVIPALEQRLPTSKTYLYRDRWTTPDGDG